MKALIAAVMLGITLSSHAEQGDIQHPAQTLDVPSFSKDNAEVYGRELVDYSYNYLSGWVDEVVHGEMVLFDNNDNSVRNTFTRMGYERHGRGDKSIIKFSSPAEIKGVSALNFENRGSSDDNWLYLPSTKKVRRISGANNTASFQGSEFTYEDLNDLDPQEYEWRYLEEVTVAIEGEMLPVYKISAVPTYKDTAYSQVVMYLHKDNWYQAKVEYYDKSGSHLKTKTTSDWRSLHGRYWRPHYVKMVNHQTGKKTELRFDGYYVDLSRYKSNTGDKNRPNLNESMFTKRALES